MNRCLICAAPTGNGEYHPACARRFFGLFPPPKLEVSLNDIREYAARSVLERITVTGVQKKLSLGMEKKGREARFTIVGLWGGYILKPPVEEYPALPENEHTVMRLAAAAGIPVVPHAMIRLASGELAYISRRVDRNETGGKIAMEDFCQASGRLTEDKYKGSVERVGRLLRRHSAYPGLDVVDLFERALFNFIWGNADMHLKNYALLETAQGMRLSPAYDLVATMLAIPGDSEETALTINGKKSNLTKKDFDALAENFKIREQAVNNVYAKAAAIREALYAIIKEGFLPDAMRQTLGDLIEARLARIVE